MSSDEFVVQLTMLAAGGKSEKIAACWRRFAEREAGAPSPDVRAAGARGAGADGMEDLGRLGKLGLWRLMRSVLSAMVGVLVCSTHDGEEDEPEDRVQREGAQGPAQLLPNRSRRLNVEQTRALQTKIDLAALSVAESVLRATGHAGSEADAYGNDDDEVLGDDGIGVDYDEFSEWYNQGGRTEAPYLEMLDLGKWPSAGYSVGDDGQDEEDQAPASGAGAGYDDEAQNEHEDEEEEEEEDEPVLPERVREFDPFRPGPTVFSMALPRRSRGRGPTSGMVFGPTHFTVREGDLASLACLQDLTGLGRMPAAELATLALSCSPVAAAHPSGDPSSREAVRSVVANALRSTSGGSVTKASYNSAMRRALPSAINWSDKAASFVSFKVSHFFWMFHLQDRFVVDTQMSDQAGDVAGTPEERAELMRILNEQEDDDDTKMGHAPVLGLAAGLAVLGGGAKSEKLAIAWRIFAGQHPMLMDEEEEEEATGQDEGGDAETNDTGSLALTRPELFNLLRSLLTGLLALDRVSSCEPDADVRIAVAEASSAMVDETFANSEVIPPQTVGNVTTMERITFNSFAEFYNAHGQKRLSWLELLDLRKWVTDSDAGARLAAALEPRGGDEDGEDDEGLYGDAGDDQDFENED